MTIHMDDIHLFISSLPLWYSHIFLISFIHLITWGYCITIRGFCSDDIEGIAKFSDRFVQEKDPQGNIVKEYKLDYYEVQWPKDQKDKDGKLLTVKVPNVGKDPTIGWPNWFMRWWRLNLGKSFQKIGENSKGHIIYGYVQSARRHHAINIVLQLFNLLLGYNLLSRLFGSNLAFLSIVLFAVHPCGVQTVGWISGVNYVLSLFGALLTFNIPMYVHNPYILYPLLSLTSYISCMTLLPGCFNFVILFILGYRLEILPSLLIGLFVLSRQGREAVSFRIKAFKEQNMQRSTFLSLSKPIVMIKTLWYYVRLVFYPKRLGLFHTWGYHYEEPIEHTDGLFLFGFISLIAISLGIYVGSFPIQFGLIWFMTYLLIFSNIVTAQQFVSERYAYIPTFGFSLVLAYFLIDYPVLIAFIVGVFIMRIWMHLPTFKNEVLFYESNCFNFPQSEVAMGNLGVAYLNHGMHYKAFDEWNSATRQNPLYDVPWYNLYSISKQNGDILNARRYLQKCLDAHTVHFPEQWKKELAEMDIIIAKAISDGRLKQVPQPQVQPPV